MYKRFNQLIRPPTFDDPEKTRYAQNLNTILLAVFGLMCVYLIYTTVAQNLPQIIAALSVMAILISMLYILQRGHVQLSGVLFCTLLWLAFMGMMIAFGGIRNSGFATVVVLVIIAALTLGVRSGLIFGLLSILAAGGLAYAEGQGWLPVYNFESTTTILVSHSLTLMATALLLFLILGNISQATRKAVLSEQTQREINIQLAQNRLILESRMQTLEQRNRALQTIAEIAELGISTQDQSTLSNQLVRHLAGRMQLDHVNIFLLDETEESAILHASNSQSGQALVNEGFCLSIAKSQYGLYPSRSEATLQFIINGVGHFIEQPKGFSAPLASNISVPLATRDRLIGLLNVQDASREVGTEELVILQTLAGQIAMLLENRLLVTRLQDQIREISHIAGRTSQEIWKSIKVTGVAGYQYDRMRITPISGQFPAEVVARLLSGETTSYVTSGSKPTARLLSPINLRGTVIGVLGYEESDPEYEWQADEITMLETVATQVGLGLENSRLVSEAQERADREQTMSEVASRMRETLDLDTVLKTTAQEMQRVLNLQETEVRLGVPSDTREIKKGKSPRR